MTCNLGLCQVRAQLMPCLWFDNQKKCLVNKKDLWMAFVNLQKAKAFEFRVRQNPCVQMRKELCRHWR